jgi:hypothetical protein
MIKRSKIAIVAVVFTVMVGVAQAGWISALKDKVTGGSAED